jgi:hypothetical protein
MMSLKKYLDSDPSDLPKVFGQDAPGDLAGQAIKACRSALVETGSCSTDALSAWQRRREAGALGSDGLGNLLNREQVADYGEKRAERP